MNGLALAWLTETGLVTWRAFKRDNRPPLPADFVASFVIFGGLGLLAETEVFAGAAAVAGWGIVVATALNLGPATHLSPQGAEIGPDGKPVKVKPVTITPTQAR